MPLMKSGLGRNLVCLERSRKGIRNGRRNGDRLLWKRYGRIVLDVVAWMDVLPLCEIMFVEEGYAAGGI